MCGIILTKLNPAYLRFNAKHSHASVLFIVFGVDKPQMAYKWLTRLQRPSVLKRIRDLKKIFDRSPFSHKAALLKHQI